MPLGVFLVTPQEENSPLAPRRALRGTLLVRAFSPSDARLVIMEDQRYADASVLSPDSCTVVEVNFGDDFTEAGPRGVIARFD